MVLEVYDNVLYIGRTSNAGVALAIVSSNKEIALRAHQLSSGTSDMRTPGTSTSTMHKVPHIKDIYNNACFLYVDTCFRVYIFANSILYRWYQLYR